MPPPLTIREQQMNALGGALKCDPVQNCPKEGKKDWIGVRVVDEDGKPVKDVKVRLKLTDGSVTTVDFASAKLEADGSYRTEKILDPGDCEISFPDLFDVEWKAQ
jgi:hypothetical protein